MSFELYKKNGKIERKITNRGFETRNHSTVWCINQADKIYNWQDFDNITIDSNKDGYINLLIIQSEGYFDDYKGEWNTSLGIKNKEGEELVSQELMEYLILPETKELNYGRLINLSMQINLSFQITTIENKISKIESNII